MFHNKNKNNLKKEKYVRLDILRDNFIYNFHVNMYSHTLENDNFILN